MANEPGPTYAYPVPYFRRHTTYPLNRFRIVFGSLLILAGAAILVFGLPDLPFFWHRPFSYTKEVELKPGEAGFPQLASYFPVEKLSRYAIRHSEGQALPLEVADFRDAQGTAARAIVFVPTAATPDLADSRKLRNDLWADAAKSIAAHAGPHALFLSWWDDAQRLSLLAGVESWTSKPPAEAFRDSHERRFWEEAAGGFAQDAAPARQLARWLTMDAEQALEEMRETLPKDRDIYWLVTADDLARLGEIETLAGVSLPLETQVFAQGKDFHGLIGSVKQWAQAQGSGNYLVQQLPGIGVRAWRVAAASGDNLLLTRLLPFTASLGKLPEGLQLVYQSEQAYLSVYRLAR